MSVQVTCCTTKLTAARNCLQLLQLLFKTVSKHLYFLTQACGRCGLTVSLCKHSNILPFLSEIIKLVNHILQQGDVNYLCSILNHQGERSVVDVLRSKTEVHKLLILIQTTDSVKFLFDEVFNCLNVVICNAFNILYTLSILQREVLINFSKLGEKRTINTNQLGQGKFAKRNVIFNFNTHTILHQRIL